jgi:hypothetical protein
MENTVKNWVWTMTKNLYLPVFIAAVVIFVLQIINFWNILEDISHKIKVGDPAGYFVIPFEFIPITLIVAIGYWIFIKWWKELIKDKNANN